MDHTMEPVMGDGGAPNGHIADAKEEPRPISRNKANDEDATLLQLGSEFAIEKAQPLFHAEAARLLTVKYGPAVENDSEMNRVLRKSMRYTSRFDSIQNQENTVEVRELLEKVQPALHPFEIAQLASLVPKDAEEAKAIIPSLARTFENEDLNKILKDLEEFVR